MMLLRQILCDRPFLKPRERLSAAWDAVAAKLIADDSFPRLRLGGKNTQSRFDKLVELRRLENEKSFAASEISEEETERSLLLDELIELVDDHIEAVTVVKAADFAKRQRDEEASAVARRLTMETLSEKQGVTPNKKPRKTTEMKLQDRKEARAEQAKKREADREHMISMVQAVTKSILEFMAANNKK
ncbi:hypothetical protein BBJ28_00021120 [Nothophytophthora sp. Chile5]|nr:hypothetical protein BBJ28_00021120 [Nothophytophthora sp. Chile5]